MYVSLLGISQALHLVLAGERGNPRTGWFRWRSQKLTVDLGPEGCFSAWLKQSGFCATLSAEIAWNQDRAVRGDIMVMSMRRTGPTALAGSCATIFWPGAFVFGLPGVLAPYWQAAFGANPGAIGKILFFVLAATGLFMFLAGRWQEKVGPTCLTAFGVILCGASTIMLSYARGMGIVYVWAFLVGVSSTLVYIPALTVVQRWFPLKRGVVSGTVSLSFGFSAAILSPAVAQMTPLLGYPMTTRVLGLAALVLGLLAVPFVSFPKAEPFPSIENPGTGAGAPQPSITVSQCLRTRTFWFLWFAWAFGGAAGISMVTLSAAYGMSRGLPIQKAVLILTAFNLTNGLSRVVSGYVSDLLNRHGTIGVSFLAAGCAYGLMTFVEGLPLWTVLAAAIGFAFGTLFSVSAPLVVDRFGMKHFGAIFGLVFTAYGFVSGPLGPWLSGHLLAVTRGDFRIVFAYLGLCSFVAAFFAWWAKPR